MRTTNNVAAKKRRPPDLLDQFGTSASSLKDIALSISGSMAAAMHAFAGDEILKNTFANHAFENFEIAAYCSLITLGEAGGFGDATELFNKTLAEERRMADWLLEEYAKDNVALRATIVRR